MGVSVGIDLGTTYSLVAVLTDGVPTVLPNANGETLTPSAVSVEEDGTVLVGPAARARATTHPERTALAFKRDMGTDRSFVLGPRSFTPQDLSALVLGALKRDAEEALGATVDEAVVTVPAYFGDRQRQATRDAAAIAGLHVERIINEPTAAALAYGLHARNREQRVVVLDLGGGTFDVTVLEIIEGVIEIQASSGDSRLGGEDFVDVLATRAELEVEKKYGVKVARDQPRSLARIREACELAKRRLTEELRTSIVLPQLVVEGAVIDVELPLGREEAEASFEELLGRVRRPVMRALRDARVTPERIDEVLLVGGATRMPCVVKLAAQLFGRMPSRSLPPDEAVAMGAAVQAALKRGDALVEEMVVTDVAPFTMGIATATKMGRQHVDGLFTPILERGTVIPASRERRFVTLEESQRELRIEVYQGEHSLCRDNTKLGEFLVRDLPRGAAGEQAVDVRFTYDLNGILEVEMTLDGTDRRETLVIEDRPGRLTSAQIQAAREAMARIKFHPRETLPNKTALARADALYVELTGPAREELGHAIAVFRGILEQQDAAMIDQVRARLVSLTEELRR